VKRKVFFKAFLYKHVFACTYGGLQKTFGQQVFRKNIIKTLQAWSIHSDWIAIKV
jgi:hypothetical protein